MLMMPALGSTTYLDATAYAGVEISGAEVTATWTEPTENMMNDEGIVLPLMDLDATWVTHEEVEGTDGEIQCGEPVPASAATGGGAASVKCVIPIRDNAVVKRTFRARAIDMSGNVSPPAEKTRTFDLLRSAPPGDF